MFRCSLLQGCGYLPDGHHFVWRQGPLPGLVVAVILCSNGNIMKESLQILNLPNMVPAPDRGTFATSWLGRGLNRWVCRAEVPSMILP